LTNNSRELQSNTNRRTDTSHIQDVDCSFSCDAHRVLCTHTHTRKENQINKPVSKWMYTPSFPHHLPLNLQHVLRLPLQILFEINLPMINTKRLATGYTVRRSNPGWDEISCTRPHRFSGPPSLIYNGYRLSFPGGKAAGTWR
jgi:hypothetical protein